MPPWQQQVQYLIGQPVGISLINGQGVSGVLCNVDHRQRVVYIMTYLYQSQYATKHYRFDEIQDITPFPGCYAPSPHPQPGPFY